MKYLFTIILMVCSFAYTELRRRNNSFVVTEITIEITDVKNRRKRKERKYKNKKYQPKRHYVNRRTKYQGTHSKDSRYSNQRRIRRMYRNS